MSGILNMNSRIDRHPDVLATEIDGEIVLMSIDLGKYFGLAESGRRIWELLAVSRTLSELVTILQGEFLGPDDVISHDVLEYVERLRTENLVRVE